MRPYCLHPLGDFEVDGGTISEWSASPYGPLRLDKIVQRSGDIIRIERPTYNANGRQEFRIQHYDAQGNATRSVVFERDDQGRIVAISDPLGQDSSGKPAGPPAVKYEYDGAGNLSKVLKLVDRAGAGTYLTNRYYDENPNFRHYLTKIVDARGVPVARNLYDEQGRLYGVIDASGRTNLFEHYVEGRTEIVHDRMGNQTIYEYDERGNVTATIDPVSHKPTYRTYDDPDNPSAVTSVTDQLGNTTSYEYDTDGNRTMTVDPLGRTNLFSYDTHGNLLTQIDSLGNSTVNIYDNANNLTETIQRDASGAPVGGSSSTTATAS